MCQSRFHRFNWLLVALLCSSLLLPGRNLPVAHAEPSAGPSVIYNSAINTIYIGSNGGMPNTESITIPGLATNLAGQGLPNLVVDELAGAWLLNANIVISTTARLEVTNATLTELRLNSPPVTPINITTNQGGYLLIDHAKVIAWEGNTVDTNITNGRSYLVALNGGRMDILTSEIAYLGWSDGETSGISWRERRNDADPTTGSTGIIQDSNIHHNYFGMYSYAAYGVKILHNQVHDNIYYGIDPHTGSQNFEVAHNFVYNNGKHGIIFSRDCINNHIYDNIVHDNAQHGIMMDRGSNNNLIENNTVYNNDDGFAVFQSSNNTIRNNTAYANNRGVRINATFDTTDPFDEVSTANQVLNNTLTDNKQQGVYLYARADRNTISGNTIISTTINGIYIKSGGNRVENNLIQQAGVGINISGTDLNNPPQGKPALELPGQNNIVISTTISNDSDVGIRILGGSHNRIGSLDPAEKGNRIENNGSDGIVIGPTVTGTVSTDNQLLGNMIRNNQRHGISIKVASSVRNQISQNMITGNLGLGIKVDTNAQAGILPPGVTISNGQINGTALAGAKVEIYSDPTGEGQTFLGAVTATGGNWSYVLPNGQNPKLVTAFQTDSSGNSSAFYSTKTVNASYSVGADVNGQTTITVTGASASVTLEQIRVGLGVTNTKASLIKCGSDALLSNLGQGIWQLNANLTIGPNVTLNLTPQDGVNELRLCSRQQSVTASSAKPMTVIKSDEAADTASTTVAIDPLSFIYLRIQNGIINIDSIKIHSWDPVASVVDTNIIDGRAYILAKYNATMNIKDSELSYLGSAEGESYGVAWRDTNDPLKPTELRTRVTGNVINSNFHHNYYGVYTFQAKEMLFSGNQFHDNVRYGFDPHDFTHDVTVENNKSYSNGAHGFIISRGCNNFVFRGNSSYNNSNPDPLAQAQGFMLDPGSIDSMFPQAPSTNNVLENNVAYDNEGSGLRILGSTDNQVLNNNHFYRNDRGIVIDTNSTANIIDSNVITQNRSYGVVTQDNTANGNTISHNTVNENAIHGIYIHSNNNLIMGNMANNNKLAGIALLSSVMALLNNQVLSNTVSGNGDNGLDLRNTDNTLAQGNVVESNLGHGIYLSKGASQNSFTHNIIHNNQKFGIQANDLQTLGNTWSENQIYANQFGGISLVNGANQNVTVPMLLNVVGNVVNGRANPGVTVEVFSDNGAQGQFYEGKTTARADGSFSFTFAPNAQTVNLTALSIDAQGNASIFNSPPISKQGVLVPTGTPAPTDTPDGSTATPDGQTPTPTTTPTATLTPTPPVTVEANTFIFLPVIRR